MKLEVHADAGALASELAARLGAITDAALAARGQALIALAGGRTPMPIYRAFAAQPRDWSKVTIVATDERWVAVDHPARNETGIAEAFGGAVGVNLLPLVPAHPASGASAAFACTGLRDADDAFDAVLLGMGADAHTASLFPASPGVEAAMDAQASEDAFVVVPEPLPPEAPYARITLGRRRLLKANALLLAITGTGKREVLDRVVAAADPARHPVAAFLQPQLNMTVHWSP